MIYLLGTSQFLWVAQLCETFFSSLISTVLLYGNLSGFISTVPSPDKLGSHLRHLLHESERRVLELGGSRLLDRNSHYHSTLSINRGSISVADSDRTDKTLALWERRCKGLKKMLLGFDQASEFLFQPVQFFFFFFWTLNFYSTFFSEHWTIHIMISVSIACVKLDVSPWFYSSPLQYNIAIFFFFLRISLPKFNQRFARF